MNVFEYIETAKYKNYIRNKEIYDERSAGIFRATVNSRVKLELMGSGAIVNNDTVFTGFENKQGNFSNIGDLIVPSNLLSAITSTYISYSTNGRVLFNGKESEYMLQKVKTAIKEQSIGGSCLLKLVNRGGQPYINIFNAISYYAEKDEEVQDLNRAYVIFNLVEESADKEIYLLERHEDKIVTYRYIQKTTETKGDEKIVTIKYIDCLIEGLAQKKDANQVTYSYEQLTAPAVQEVTNLVFNGDSDYTDDNIALLREIVVTNTINSQTFDKISNPLLAMPEEALEYDENGNAKVNLQDRVVIIREGGAKPEQISLESRIEQSNIHRDNMQGQIFSSLAVNTVALGMSGEGSALSGIALERMLSNTASRVEEKRKNVAKAFFALTGVVINFSDPIGENRKEEIQMTKTAVDGGFMSIKQACTEIGNEDDYKQILKESKALLNGDYEGFDEDNNEDPTEDPEAV